MAIIFSLSWLLNKTLKYAFDLPRPHDLDSTVGILTSSTPGFPSGASQTAALMCGIIITEWKSKWRWLAGPLFALLLTFSRIYLGLHFPTDVLGGLLVGTALFWIYLQLDHIPGLAKDRSHS
jgi:membrane-associated phospholipid phosphatase